MFSKLYTFIRPFGVIGIPGAIIGTTVLLSDRSFLPTWNPSYAWPAYIIPGNTSESLNHK